MSKTKIKTFVEYLQEKVAEAYSKLGYSPVQDIQGLMAEYEKEHKPSEHKLAVERPVKVEKPVIDEPEEEPKPEKEIPKATKFKA